MSAEKHIFHIKFIRCGIFVFISPSFQPQNTGKINTVRKRGSLAVRYNSWVSQAFEAAAAGRRESTGFAVFQRSRNRHFWARVLTPEPRFTVEPPYRGFSLFLFHIRINIMDGGQWPKKIINYELTRALIHTFPFFNYQLTDRHVEAGSSQSLGLHHVY